ncbi:hypothetical protein B5D80_17835 [Micromonospora wenchangensis]|uniref:Methyltransferase FkbM domain-containing protein n=1 Tax=Micromonospora wenchangensis TaxID=1185415 RepID=A0A246RK27_9ACTN|nr:hypothetical protein B5D80_17835 [Micromonospora wenchangensis]
MVTELRPFTLDDRLTVWAPYEAEARWQYDEIFSHRCYDGVQIEPDGIVIDVGANIGLFTLFLKRKFPDARVRAFEPMPQLAQALRRNIEEQQLDAVSVNQRALGTRQERAVFEYYPLAPGNSTRYPADKELQIAVLSHEAPEEFIRSHYRAEPVAVQVDRLSDHLAPDEHVGLVKIDVEGAELDVLHGIDHHHWGLIDQFLLEVQDLDGRLAAVTALLEAHDFTVAVEPSPLIPPEIRTFLVAAVRQAP